MPPPEPHLRFSKHQRLRSTDDFRSCYDHGQRAGDQQLLIFAIANGLAHSRIGLCVSKKHGNAVCRNRRKRLLREAFRLLQHQLPAGLDMVLIPRQRPDPTLAAYQDSLRRLANKLARRISHAASKPRGKHS